MCMTTSLYRVIYNISCKLVIELFNLQSVVVFNQLIFNLPINDHTYYDLQMVKLKT